MLQCASVVREASFEGAVAGNVAPPDTNKINALGDAKVRCKISAHDSFWRERDARGRACRGGGVGRSGLVRTEHSGRSFAQPAMCQSAVVTSAFESG